MESASYCGVNDTFTRVCIDGLSNSNWILSAIFSPRLVMLSLGDPVFCIKSIVAAAQENGSGKTVT
jgi:hypothetical protein